MRFSSVLIASVSHVAFGRDPCQDLCDRDGPSFCAEGSEAILTTEGIEICSNYYLAEDGSYTYSLERLPFDHLVLSDLPQLLANIDLYLSVRVQPQDLFANLASTLERYALGQRNDLLEQQLARIARRSSSDQLLRNWEKLQGPRLLEFWFRRARSMEIDLAAPFAFISAGKFERGTEIEFSKASGLYDFCSSLLWYREPFRDHDQSKLVHSFGHDLYKERPRKRLQRNLGTAHLFCPQLLQDPFVAGALLSLKVRGDVRWSQTRPGTGSAMVMAPEQSAHMLNITPIEFLKLGELYGDVGNEVEWLTKVGFKIARDADLTTFTDDAGILDRLDSKYKAFGRFLAYLLLNVVPAPMGALPRELLEGMLGNVANMRPGNFARIAQAFQEIVPVELSREFIRGVNVLEAIFSGVQIDTEIIQIMRKSVLANSWVAEIDDLPFAGGRFNFCGLFDILYDLSPEELRQFLYRVSGLVAVPLDGLKRWRMAFSVQAISDVNEISVAVIAEKWVIRIPFSSFRTLDDFRDTILRFIHREV